jgi:hypothetical protein
MPVSSEDDNEGFWDRPEPGQPIVNGRYRATDPVTGEPRDYTRVTHFNGTISDNYGLTQWKLYQLLLGLALRPDLRGLMMTLDVADPDRSVMREIVKQAHVVAGTQSAANNGNAVHAALAAADLGKHYPPEFEPFVRSYRTELARVGLAVVPGMVEVKVCHRDHEVMGTLDRLLQDRQGQIVVGDIKSGKINELEHRVQLAEYATAQWWQDGKSWHPMPSGDQRVSDTQAVLIQIDLEGQTVALYDVDLEAGRASANLCMRVRADRNRKGTILPYVPPGTANPAAQIVQQQALHATAGPLMGETRTRDDGVTVQWNGQVWVPPAMNSAQYTPPSDGTRRVNPATGRQEIYQLGEWMELPPSEQVPRGGLVTASGAEAEPAPRPESFGDFDNRALPSNGHAPGIPAAQTIQGGPEHVTDTTTFGPNRVAVPVVGAAVCPTCRLAPKTRDELKRLDKAGLQALCRAHGVTEPLNKNKDPLIGYLAAKGHVVGETAPAATLNTAPNPADPAEITGPIGGVDPTDPRSPQFEQLRLERLRAASSVNELGAIYAEVTRLGGQQAWTPMLAATAKERAAALEPPVGQPAPPDDDPMALLAAAKTQEDIANIWSAVTLGGTQGERWTAEVGAYAQQRIAEIQNAPRAAALNPYAMTPGVTA